jgi:hypothetical protein
MSPRLFSAFCAVALALVPLACSRMTAGEAKLRQEFSIPPDMPMRDLGVVELKPDTPKHVSLGKGKECTITATVLTNGLLQIKLAYESKVTDRYSTRTDSQKSQFLLPQGKRCAPKVANDLILVMQPVVK